MQYLIYLSRVVRRTEKMYDYKGQLHFWENCHLNQGYSGWPESKNKVQGQFFFSQTKTLKQFRLVSLIIIRSVYSSKLVNLLFCFLLMLLFACFVCLVGFFVSLFGVELLLLLLLLVCSIL